VLEEGCAAAFASTAGSIAVVPANSSNPNA